MQTVIYARCNTAKSEPVDLHGQIAACRPIAGESASVYQDVNVAGLSTAQLGSGLGALIEDARAGKVGTVVVKDFTRFGRNFMPVMRLLHELEALGVAVVDASGNEANTLLVDMKRQD